MGKFQIFKPRLNGGDGCWRSTGSSAYDASLRMDGLLHARYLNMAPGAREGWIGGKWGY